MNEALTVSGLTKFFGKRQVLHDVSFSIEPGHIVGLIGANGAGKTTIMKIILSLTSYQQGTIQWGTDTITPTHHPALAKVGALIEYPGVYPFLTGRDHLRLFQASTTTDQRVSQLTEQLELTDYLDRKVKSYSLGMKQKLGIALALLNEPELVILDEPMNGLDPKATKQLRDLILAEQRQGVSFLISSHILSELQKLAEDVVIIDHGTIVRSTTMAELLTANQHYLELVTDQDAAAATVLQNAGFTLRQTKPLQVVQDDATTLNKVMHVLEDHQIVIQDLQHGHQDLEDSLLAVLDADQEEH